MNIVRYPKFIEGGRFSHSIVSFGQSASVAFVAIALPLALPY
jgi:hypothetical protein